MRNVALQEKNAQMQQTGSVDCVMGRTVQVKRIAAALCRRPDHHQKLIGDIGMKRLKRCLGLLLAVVFVMSAVSVACAAAPEPPVPGGSVPFCTNAGATVLEVLKHLDLPDGWVSAADDIASALAPDAVVSTGMIAHGPGQSTPIVVLGDVLGTGQIGLSQLIRLAQALSGLKELVGTFLQAGDLNGNGSIDISDLTMLAVYFVTGEMPASGGTHVPETDTMAIANAVRSPLINPYKQGADPSAESAAKGANDFAFRFSSALLSEQKDQNANFVCSPYSVWLPLAALVNATDEQKRGELLEAIDAAGLSADQINTAASRMLYGLTGSRQNEWFEEAGEPKVDPLKIANAVFVDRDRTINPDFAKVFASNYLGESISVDFSSNEAVDAVNKWCSDNTDGLIPKIIEEFSPDTVAAIANAIYFSDRWEAEFNPDDTKDDVFHSPAGDLVSPFMCREGDMLSYYEDDSIQAMPLRFTTGGGLAVLLPKDGDAGKLLASMTDERLTQILGGTQRRSGKLLLPRFEIDSDAMNLLDTLDALGVPLLDPNDPAITKLLTNSDPLYISEALQSAKIQVDEKGTTAAAVTIMAMAEGACIEEPTEKFEMNCNHPFVFVLYGDTYDGGSQVLFTGIVNQPEPAPANW